MIGLIKSIRLPECVLIVALGIIGFKHSSVPVDTLSLVTLFFVISVTMLQNDCRDRLHDIGKGKHFVSNNPTLFISWLILFWIICLKLITTLFFHHPSTAILLLCMVLIGAFYSEARKVPFLSVILVTITSASPLLIPLTYGAHIETVLILFITTALIIFGRETLHDIADVSVDKNYKKTMPIILGDRFTRTTSTISLIFGCILAISITPLTLIGSVFIFWGLIYIKKDILVAKVRRRVDIGLLLLVLILLFF